MVNSWRTFLALIALLVLIVPSSSFVPEANSNLNNAVSRVECTSDHVQHAGLGTTTQRTSASRTKLMMAQVSEKEAQAGINKVVQALRKDKSAKEELGNLVSVNNVLGYGSPIEGKLAVRFNASFKKGGMGRSAVPMPFGLGQTNEGEGRGTMVGQVKADVDTKTGKVTSCSVFRDLGYGRAFNLKV